MAFDAELAYVFSSPAVGTPPFRSGLYLRNSLTDFDRGDFQDLLEVLATAWDDHLNPVIWSGLHAGQLVANVSSDTISEDFSTSVVTSDSSGQSCASGIALRLVFNAGRPPKARANAMYVPLPTAAAANVEGVVSTDAKTAGSDFGDAVIAACDGTDWLWMARHQVGGPTSSVTRSTVTGITVAPTASYLRRRYR